MYKLTVGGYSGSIPNSYALRFNGMKFSTRDNDNDRMDRFNCADTFKSGNWHSGVNYCIFVDLSQQSPYVYPPGDVTFGEMKIRPTDCIIQ